MTRMKLFFGLALGLFSIVAWSHDLTRLPLGDGKLAQAPRKGWIWACHTEPDSGGAFRDGPWIKSDGTYDLTAKAVVPGSVSWPHRFTIQVRDGRRVFSSNDLPPHPTGIFPIPADSAAYQYDRNPNRIREQNVLLELPANPVPAAQPGCTPGAVGILLSGVSLFNALDAPGRDAVAHETQDQCQGHPQVSGMYHYHSVSTCVEKSRPTNAHSPLVGYMVDGFGIYGRYGEGGKLLTSDDLDECHGHTHPIDWDGRKVAMYHYHATWDFPYTAGCMRGTYRMSDVMKLSGGPPALHNGAGPAGNIRRDDRRGSPPEGGMPEERGAPPDGMEPFQGPPPGGHPDLNVAARKLGISVEKLRAALGPPPPDLHAAAARLGIGVTQLRDALGVPLR